MPRPDHITRLYSVPLSEFTATRKHLADELRKKGRADEARAVARLRKPSATLWAVNRLATTEPARLSALFDAVARLRQSQLRDPKTAAESLRAQRAALESLVARGRDVLTGAGLSASQQALRRLSDTLMGAAIDREHADALRRGELTEELSAPGFEAFSGVRVPASPRLRLVRSSAASDPPPAEREAVAARAAEAERRRAEADTLARRAADHTRDVTELEEERSAARGRVADLDRRLRMARRAARQATAAAKRARRNAEPT